jgi:hypothetical protein
MTELFHATANGPVVYTPEETAEWEARQAAYTPPRRTLPKSLVQERVAAIGKLAAAMGELRSSGRELLYARWFASDKPSVYADDEGLLAVLAAAGCTGEEIAEITTAS